MKGKFGVSSLNLSDDNPKRAKAIIPDISIFVSSGNRFVVIYFKSDNRQIVEVADDISVLIDLVSKITGGK